MKYIVYILLCDKKTFYTGITRSLRKRLEEHKNKQSFFTKKFSDIKIVYQEEYIDKESAEQREKQLKGWSNAKKKALIKKDLDQLRKLSKVMSLAKSSQGREVYPERSRRESSRGSHLVVNITKFSLPINQLWTDKK